MAYNIIVAIETTSNNEISSNTEPTTTTTNTIVGTKLDINIDSTTKVHYYESQANDSKIILDTHSSSITMSNKDMVKTLGPKTDSTYSVDKTDTTPITNIVPQISQTTSIVELGNKQT